jgi:hypothetical protein
MALALARNRLLPRRLDFVLLFGLVEFALSFWFSGFCARALKSKPKLETAKTTATRTIIEPKLFLFMDLFLPRISSAHFRDMRQDRINRCQGDQSQLGVITLYH